MTVSRVLSSRRALIACISAAALVGGAALSGVVATSASAETPDPSQFRDLITLQTGSTTVIKSYGPNGSTGVSQTLTSKSSDCTLQSTGGPIITFGASPAKRGEIPGMRAGSIGIVDKTTGESCGQVNAPGETLILSLPAAMSRAVLDVEVQKDAVITATLSYLGGNTVNKTLRSGQAALNGTGEFFSCRPGDTSSAPNSGPSDNCRWVIDSAIFDKITLKAEQGQFALEGGGDGDTPINPIETNPQEPNTSAWPTNMTYFAAADGLLCGDTVTLEGTDTAPAVTIKRVADVQGTSCTSIPYALSGAGGSFTFSKPVGDESAQFYIDVVWKAKPGAVVKTTTIQYPNTTTTIPLDWCPTSVFTADALGAGLTAADAIALADQGAGTTAKEFACLLASASSKSGSVLNITQRIYLLGDPIIRG